LLAAFLFEDSMTVLKASQENIVQASQIVRNGGLVVYPTETVYGLGCDPFNVEAVKHLLDVKCDRLKPLPVLAASLVDVENAAFVTPNARVLAERFWPGSLTLVLSKKPSFPNVVTFGLDSVGLRIPYNDVALRLIRLCGGLLIGSSANRTGEAPARSVQELSEELKAMVDVVLDDGDAVHGVPSTVADLTSEKPKILREGPITSKEILDILTFSA
jgi:L-threonylcarbamoyladenylate synthase